MSPARTSAVSQRPPNRSRISSGSSLNQPSVRSRSTSDLPYVARTLAKLSRRCDASHTASVPCAIGISPNGIHTVFTRSLPKPMYTTSMCEPVNFSFPTARSHLWSKVAGSSP